MTNVELKENPSILLNNNFENLVNAFALYYGEDKIDEIRNTFSNCMLIGYLIPDELLDESKIGVRVTVPVASRTLEGFVLSIKDKSEYDDIKSIINVVDKSF